MHRSIALLTAAVGLTAPSLAAAQILGGPHANTTFSPFGALQDCVTHQVFRSGLFAGPIRINSIGFAPGHNGVYDAEVTVRMGYTLRLPNLAGGSSGLDQPDFRGGGSPNAFGRLSPFSVNPAYTATFSGASTSNFQMDFASPHGFVYFPALGNLLMELQTSVPLTLSVGVSMGASDDNASRAFTSAVFPGGAGPLGPLRTEIIAQPVVPAILPTWPHAGDSRAPIATNAVARHHQVYMAPTLTPMSAGGKLAIQAVRHAPTAPGSFVGGWRINMGYTNRRAGLSIFFGGLDLPGSNGSPNASGPLTTVFDRTHLARSFTSAHPDNFQLEFRCRPFIYDPARGNLLVEHLTIFTAFSQNIPLSRADASLESSRSLSATLIGNEQGTISALRTEFVATPLLEQTRPDLAHAANNALPFNANQTSVVHQVFAAGQFGAAPVRIHSVAFAPGSPGEFSGDVTIRLGYTDRAPGAPSPSGLSVPDAGGGTPNASLPMTLFRSGPFIATFSNPGPENFQMIFEGQEAFRYNPALGNLLVEIVAVNPPGTLDLGVSRAAGGPLASRSFRSSAFGAAENPTQATRMRFGLFVDQLPCDADLNADGVVDFNDFLEFLNLYNDQNPLVDLNDDGVVDFNDLLDYLNQFNGPC
jgi:hypothetical protein